jgi:hypothetical protein
VERVEYWESSMTQQSEISPQHHSATTAVRWALIALCAALILFTHEMSARVGFAALLVIAVIVGRYGSRVYRRTAATQGQAGSRVEPHTPGAADEPARRREAGR